MKFALAALSICVIGAFVALMLFRDVISPKSAEDTGNLPPAKAETANPISISDFSWQISDAPDYEETMPRQNVSLTVRGNIYKIGSYLGCSTTSPNVVLEPQEITRVTCWFAGGGNDISVFQEGESYVVKKRWTQESGGPEVNAAPYGPFETIVTI